MLLSTYNATYYQYYIITISQYRLNFLCLINIMTNNNIKIFKNNI